MTTLNTFQARNLGMSRLALMTFGGLGLMLLALSVMAAGNTGGALQTAFTAIDEIVNGYGKQLLTVCGFAVAAIGYMTANSTGVIMKFLGYAIFLGVGLTAAVGLVGATI